MLGHLKTFWHDVHSYYRRHDAVLQFSGYRDVSNVVGAAFVKGICDILWALLGVRLHLMM